MLIHIELINDIITYNVVITSIYNVAHRKWFPNKFSKFELLEEIYNSQKRLTNHQVQSKLPKVSEIIKHTLAVVSTIFRLKVDDFSYTTF